MAGPDYDVIVVGAGNAGLSAALAAQQMGTKVLLLDKCPKASRGGNTRFSGGGFRFTYNGIDDMRPMLPDLSDEEASKLEVGSYTASDFFEDVMQVTEYAADKKLTNILVDQSYATARWLTEMNVKWILSTSTHAVKVGGKMRFLYRSCHALQVGGGRGTSSTLPPFPFPLPAVTHAPARGQGRRGARMSGVPHPSPGPRGSGRPLNISPPAPPGRADSRTLATRSSLT